MWAKASSAALPAGDRFEWFSDLVTRELAPIAIRPESGDTFHGDAAVLDLGRVQVSTFSYTPLRSRRTPALIRQSDPEQYHLALLVRGTTWFSQQRNECLQSVGDMVMWDTSRPFDSGTKHSTEPINAVVIQVPKQALPLRQDRIDRLLSQTLSGDRGMGAVLAGFLRTVSAHGPDCAPHERSRLDQVALDLFSACLAAHLDICDQLSGEARAEALLARIDAFIDHNLGDTELTPGAIAAHHHISVRRLHQLFAGRDETVAATIRRRRLERCRADLARPELLGHPVHAIAARWGYPNPAVFSRAFRAAYGASPTDHRGQAVHRWRARSVKGACADDQGPNGPRS
ncbi:helix-turn-helix domain-containing protein [Streptomyces sp. NPDC094032]|uniref:AraC-like ligand-binding domain-containing protein n=1 Tax=Streptomyces sp. NPDC094032 TaxID=3155308 RepID=UPI003327ECBD